MDFVSGRDGGFPNHHRRHHHQDENTAGRSKLTLSYSNSSQSSSPTSSPHQQYKTAASLVSPGWSQHDQPGPDTKLELMTESEDDIPAPAAARRVEHSTMVAVDSTDLEAAAAADHHGRLEKEHMFDKVVTPSDVGKLNRLVIPKQHAEKYFPLDSAANEKGLLLNFQDRNGKSWRFRYSYWNSSQSYVMTKGWSRFVKEKKLDAGDIVSFQRGVGRSAKDHLYIDWRRRPDTAAAAAAANPLMASHLRNFSHHHHYLSLHHRRSPSSLSSSMVPWSPLLMRPPPVAAASYGHAYRNNSSSSYISGSSTAAGGSYGFGNVVNPVVCSAPVYYLRSGVPVREEQLAAQPQEPMPMVFESVPVVHGKAAAKRLRLFGVNMECPTSEYSESSDEQCDVVSSSATIPPARQYQHPLQVVSPSSPSQSPQHHQLRLYNSDMVPLPVPTIDFFNKEKASMSFDFDV